MLQSKLNVLQLNVAKGVAPCRVVPGSSSNLGALSNTLIGSPSNIQVGFLQHFFESCLGASSLGLNLVEYEGKLLWHCFASLVSLLDPACSAFNRDASTWRHDCNWIRVRIVVMLNYVVLKVMSSRWATLYLLRLVRTTSYGVDISNFWDFPYWGVDCSFGTWSFVLVIVDICYVVQNVACFETILRLLSFLARDRRTSRHFQIFLNKSLATETLLAKIVILEALCNKISTERFANIHFFFPFKNIRQGRLKAKAQWSSGT
uniref:Uncharacterized protein n=1 Tax=Cucumis melo TaxID=3656 RepID=A0A9I9E2N3_CUCME